MFQETTAAHSIARARGVHFNEGGGLSLSHRHRQQGGVSRSREPPPQGQEAAGSRRHSVRQEGGADSHRCGGETEICSERSLQARKAPSVEKVNQVIQSDYSREFRQAKPLPQLQQACLPLLQGALKKRSQAGQSQATHRKGEAESGRPALRR